MKNRSLKRITKTLSELHGIEIDFKNSTVKDLEEALAAAMSEKDRIISESQFNNYHRNPEYTQNILIMEAIRIFLREIAPKRMPRKKKVAVAESATKKNVKAVNEGNIDMSRKSELLAQKKQLEAKIKSLQEAKKAQVKESNNVKLDVLLENDLDQAEVLLAAKEIGSDLQKMAEKLANLQAASLMSLVDRMKELFDGDKATAFDASVREQLQSTFDNVKLAKDAIDNEIAKLEGKEVGGNDMMDDDGGEDSFDNDMADDDAGLDDEGSEDLDLEDDGMEAPAEDGEDVGSDEDLGDLDDLEGLDDEAGDLDEPLGREMKAESKKPRGKKIAEGSRVKKKLSENKNYPAEVQTTLDDFEYCIKQRRMNMTESRKKVMKRFLDLRKISDDVMVSVAKMNECIDTHIRENKERLIRVVSLNGLSIPAELAEAIEGVGLTEDDFRSTILEYFEESKSKFADKQRYASFVEKVAEQTAEKPKVVAAWVAKMIENKNIAEMAGENFDAFNSRILEAQRENTSLDLNDREKTVLTIAEMHNEIITTGFEGWYKNGGIENIEAVMEAFDAIACDDVAKYKSILEKVKSVVSEHADNHGRIDEFATDKLSQLETEYYGFQKKLEEDLTVYLNKKDD